MWRWVGRWGGGRKELCPIVTKRPPPPPPTEGRKKTGLRGSEEAVVAFYTRTSTEEMNGGKKREKQRGRVASTFVLQLNFKGVHGTCTLTRCSDRAERPVQLFCRERVKTGPKVTPAVHACMHLCVHVHQLCMHMFISLSRSTEMTKQQLG